jgi:hypothetical protein
MSDSVDVLDTELVNDTAFDFELGFPRAVGFERSLPSMARFERRSILGATGKTEDGNEACVAPRVGFERDFFTDTCAGACTR